MIGLWDAEASTNFFLQLLPKPKESSGLACYMLFSRATSYQATDGLYQGNSNNFAHTYMYIILSTSI